MIGEELTVIKKVPGGREVWRYSGKVVAQTPSSVTIEALFTKELVAFHGVEFRRGDRFLETYYADRWYNVFEVHAREDDRLVCWYCNIAHPAEFVDGTISYVDLALDLLVYADEKQLVLDEDEFAELDVDEDTRLQARMALEDLQKRFRKGEFRGFAD